MTYTTVLLIYFTVYLNIKDYKYGITLIRIYTTVVLDIQGFTLRLDYDKDYKYGISYLLYGFTYVTRT